ncbi:hypothetical protein BASA60_004516 [Batrachochytrium salamandrivorans]|nr:hypothetical protein BASA60_004516 [Batrachochytrium salamandrivorans]
MVPDSTVTLPLDAAITDKSSAQDIIRSLKNSAASLVHRLSLANTLWHSRTVYLPGKTELLLDWITVLLVRSIPTSNNNNKNNKNNNNTAAAATGNASTQNSSSRIDALAYQSSDAWSFLLTILVSVDKNLSDSLTTEQAWSLQLKVPLLPLFTAIVRWSSQNTDTDTELQLILPIAQQVFRLTTSTLAYTAGISVDQLSQLSLDVLHTLNSLADASLPVSQTLWDYSFDILTKTQYEQKLSSNQRKILSFSTQKLLPVQILLRYCLLHNSTPILSDASTLQFMAWFLSQTKHTVFHADHMLEYGQMLIDLQSRRIHSGTGDASAALDQKQGIKEILTSYPRTLLDSLGSMVNSSEPSVEGINRNRSAALEAIPIIFKCFCSSFIERGKQDLHSSVIFSLFEELYRLVFTFTPKPHSNSLASQPTASKSDLTMLGELLAVLLESDIFRPTGDVKSKAQRLLLVEIFDTLLTLAQSLKPKSEEHSPILFSWVQLIQLDFSIVADKISDMWQFVLLPKGPSSELAIDFSVILIDMFVKSRELDIMLKNVLMFFRMTPSLHGKNLKKISLLSVRCVAVLESVIRKMLPAQSMALLIQFQEELFEHYSANHLNALDSATSQSAKKRKTVSGAHSSAVVLDARLVIDLICVCLEHSSTDNISQEVILEVYSRFFHNYIGPYMDMAKLTTMDGFDQIVKYRLCPALKLHSTLIRISHTYWERHVSDKAVGKQFKRIGNIAAICSDLQGWMTKIACSHVSRAVGVSSAPAAETGCRDISHRLLDLLLCEETKGLDTLPRIIAWQAVLGNIVPISSVVHADYIGRFVDALFVSIIEQPFGKLLETPAATMGRLSAELLQCAPFYEINAVRNQVVSSVLRCVRSCMRALVKKDKGISKRIGILEAFETLNTHAALSNALELVVDLASREALQLGEGTVEIASSEALQHATHLFEILLLFPTVYFTLAEREALVAISFVLETIVSTTNAALTVPEAYIRWGFAQRRVAIRFLKSRHDRILPLQHPSIMIVLLRIQSTYDQCALRLANTVVLADSVAAETGKIIRLVTHKLIEHAAEAAIDGVRSKTVADPADYLQKLCGMIASPDLSYMYAVYMLDALNWRLSLAKSANSSSSSSANVPDTTEIHPHPHSHSQFHGTIVAIIHDLVQRLYTTVMHSSLEDKRQYPQQMGAIANELCQLFKHQADSRIESLVMHISDTLQKLSENDGDIDMASNSGNDDNALCCALIPVVLVWGADVIKGVTDSTDDLDHQSGSVQRSNNNNNSNRSTANIVVDFPSKLLGWLSDAWRLLHHDKYSDSLQISLQEFYTQSVATSLCELIMSLHLDTLAMIVRDMSYSDTLEPAKLCGLMKSLSILVGVCSQAPSRTPSITPAPTLPKSHVGLQLRPLLSLILTLCVTVAETTRRAGTLSAALALAQAVVASRHLDGSLGNVSLVFSIVRAVGANCHVDLCGAQGDSSRNSMAISIFDQIYNVLSALTRHCRENVLLLAPQLVACMCALFDLFREAPSMKLTPNLGNTHRNPHRSIRSGRDRRSDHVESHLSDSEPSFPLAITSRFQTDDESGFSAAPYRVFSKSTPLSAECAKSLSRLLVSMTQKPHSLSLLFPGTTTSQKQTKTQTRNHLVDEMHSQQDKLVRPFDKHAPFVLSHVVRIQTSARPLAFDAKEALLEGIYALLDLCTSHGRNAVLASIASPSSSLFASDSNDRSAASFIFKEFVKGWESNYKYTGKA